MKYVTYQIADNIVAFHNSLLGKESVHLNGQLVSEKYSFFGTEHYFTIGRDNYSIRPYMTFNSLCGIAFKIHKNGLPFAIQGEHDKRSPWKAFLFITLAMVIGFAFGYGLITLITK
jgi:hypothetical protein